MYNEYLCRPLEASTQYCAILGGYPPQDWQSLQCAGEELDSNPVLLICSQVHYHWATSPPNWATSPPQLLSTHIQIDDIDMARPHLLLPLLAPLWFPFYLLGIPLFVWCDTIHLAPGCSWTDLPLPKPSPVLPHFKFPTPEVNSAPYLDDIATQASQGSEQFRQGHDLPFHQGERIYSNKQEGDCTVSEKIGLKIKM